MAYQLLADPIAFCNEKAEPAYCNDNMENCVTLIVKRTHHQIDFKLKTGTVPMSLDNPHCTQVCYCISLKVEIQVFYVFNAFI